MSKPRMPRSKKRRRRTCEVCLEPGRFVDRDPDYAVLVCKGCQRALSRHKVASAIYEVRRFTTSDVR